MSREEELIEKAAKAMADWRGEEVGKAQRDAASIALAAFREHTAPEGHERTPIYDGNEHVCSGCVNSEGNNVAWDQAGHTAPTDDEREVMLESIEAGMEYYAREDLPEDGLSEAEQIADFLMDAGFRRGAPAEPAVTDEMQALREARAETWDEAVAAIFAWWSAPESERPGLIVNPYGIGLSTEENK